MDQVGRVDAIFLFDVLLHQVAPDWDTILEMYAKNVRVFGIYNQQWTGADTTVRLLDLGEEEYFRNVPVDPKKSHIEISLKNSIRSIHMPTRRGATCIPSGSGASPTMI